MFVYLCWIVLQSPISFTFVKLDSVVSVRDGFSLFDPSFFHHIFNFNISIGTTVGYPIQPLIGVYRA